MEKRNPVQLLVICLVVMFGILGAVVAQEGGMIEPLNLSEKPVVLEFSTGALQGSISARISEVTPMPSPPFHALSVMFTLETEDGVIEGYYAGSFHRSEQGDEAAINASGLILSVSGAYADLYLAEVFVTSAVQFVDGRAVGESGTMTIAPR